MREAFRASLGESKCSGLGLTGRASERGVRGGKVRKVTDAVGHDWPW